MFTESFTSIYFTRALLFRTSPLALAAAILVNASPANAQAVPNLVSACSGVSLPRSAVTNIITPVVNGIVTPIQTTVNTTLDTLGTLPLVPRLNIDAAGLLADAAAGQPITLQVLNRNGLVVGPTDRCDLQANSYSLNTQGGVAIGGNRITGLGTAGQDASAGEANSLALGNRAMTDASSANALAIGTGATVGGNAEGGLALGSGANVSAVNSVALGANSMASRGALTGYAALGLAAPQTSAGEVSVGAAGAERQITNVAAGSQPTDAVNVAQLSGVAAQVGTLAGDAVVYDGTAKASVTLAGTNGTTLTNVAPGALGTASTDAVNGSQLFATNTNVTNNAAAITNLTTAVQNGGVGPVQYSSANAPTVPNAGTPSNDVTLVGGAAAPVGLHNVAAGVLAPGSTDAVNGGQVVTLGTGLASAIGGGTTYNPATNGLTTALTYGGNQYESVQAALDAVSGATTGGAGIRYFHVQSTLGDSAVTADNGVAIGPEASVGAANSVAIGSQTLATRGAAVNYQAAGLTDPQSSAGEVSIGASGAERQLTNVAAGAAATDAVNVAQLEGVAAQVTGLAGSAVQYDGADKATVTLTGAGGTTVTNLKAGRLDASSTDAVNGAQLAATNAGVASNMAAITTLTTNVNNGSVGPVQYSSAAAPTTPNGGARTNDVTLVGGGAGSVALHNVGNGIIAAGSTDAVNGGQVYGLALTAVNAVAYDTDGAGNRTNTVTLAGGNAAAPVTVTNVAPGSVAEGSTDAVNGTQLAATNQQVAAAQATAGAALALGQNSIQYDGPAHTDVTVGGSGASTPVRVHNVAAGTLPTDAVNLSQLTSGIGSAVAQSNAYTDQRIAALSFDLQHLRRDSYAGSAGALAAAGLPQAYEPGKGMLAFAAGTYQGQSAFALGLSKALADGHTVLKLSGTRDTQGRSGGNAGIGYQF